MSELSRIDALMELGRFDEAVTGLHLLLATDGSAASDADVWCRLSLANLRLDKGADALDAAGRAAALAPGNDWPHRLASHALESAGRHDEAVRAAAEAVRLAPHMWQGHARYAATLSVAGGDLALARQAAIYAVQIAPHEPDAHSSMGLVALRQGDNDTAQRAFEYVLSLQPTHEYALNNLGVIRLRRRDVEGALSGFSAAIRSEPQLEVARRNVGVVVRAVLYRAQAFVFLAAYGTRVLFYRRGSTGQLTVPSRPMRFAVIGALAVAAVIGVLWSLRRIPPPLRPYARSVLRRSRLLQLSAALTCAAFLALVAVAVPDGAGTAVALAGAAAGLGFFGLLVGMVSRRRNRRRDPRPARKRRSWR